MRSTKNNSDYRGSKLIGFAISIATLFLSSWAIAEDCRAIDTQATDNSSNLIGYLPISPDEPKLTQLNLHRSPQNSTVPSGKYLQLSRITMKDGQDLTVLLKQDDTLIRPVLTIPLNRGDRIYGGFSTLDTIEITWPKTPPLWPVFRLTETSIPGENDRDFRPGPPLSRFYQYQSHTGCYKNVKTE